MCKVMLSIKGLWMCERVANPKRFPLLTFGFICTRATLNEETGVVTAILIKITLEFLDNERTCMARVGRDNRGKLTGSSAINVSKHPSDSRDPVPQAAYNFHFRYAIPSPNGAKLGKAWWSSRPEQIVRVAHFHSIHPIQDIGSDWKRRCRG
jgi:hypothetical protein